jgi:DAHL domain
LRAINPEVERFARAFSELDRFATVKARLRRDVLSARAGILRNYDPLVRETDKLEDWLSWLREMAAVDPEMTPALDHLTMTLAREENLGRALQEQQCITAGFRGIFCAVQPRTGCAQFGRPPGPGD